MGELCACLYGEEEGEGALLRSDRNWGGELLRDLEADRDRDLDLDLDLELGLSLALTANLTGLGDLRERKGLSDEE